MFDSTGGKGLEPTRAARLSNCISQLRHQERGRDCKDFVAKESRFCGERIGSRGGILWA